MSKFKLIKNNVSLIDADGSSGTLTAWARGEWMMELTVGLDAVPRVAEEAAGVVGYIDCIIRMCKCVHSGRHMHVGTIDPAMHTYRLYRVLVDKFVPALMLSVWLMGQLSDRQEDNIGIRWDELLVGMGCRENMIAAYLSTDRIAKLYGNKGLKHEQV